LVSESGDLGWSHIQSGFAGPLGKIGGERRGEGNALAGGGVGECELPRMEHVALEISATAVGGISGDGMPEVFQMHANLVGASGFWLALHQGFAFAGLEHAVVGEGIAASFHDGHLLAVDGVAADGGLDGAVWHAGRAIDEGEVGFFHIAGGELVGELAMGGFGFCNDEAAGGFFVQPMHDAGALDAAYDLDAGAMVEKAVGEGAFAVARAGMDYEPSGFVEDEQVFILE
jgi:hypothetical protein